MIDPRVNCTPSDFNPARDLPAGFLEFYLPLHRACTPRQQVLALKRAAVLRDSHEGKLPEHLPSSEATEGKWRIDLPDWCADQRNQMTGPSDDAELVVKMLNSGAPGVMIDLEDSMANTWENHKRGVANTLKALRGELRYYDQKRGREVSIQPSRTVIWNRARGLHLSQAGVLPDRGELTSASLFDVAIVSCQMDSGEMKHPLSFYIPKSESHEEALWWNDVFNAIEQFKGWPHGYIKCMALVEAHPMAFQMEEFVYNLRDHLVGLNLGRWDYMASLIHFNLKADHWILPDRNTIPFDVPFFQNLRELIPEICHKRGILAIGGMTALFPSREDPELNSRALAVLEKDKKNEANCLMDGAWTGHPDQNEIAVNQFPNPNQIHARPVTPTRYPNMRPLPKGVGKISSDGTRAAIRTVIRYRNGVLNGKGASLLDGYMEDLATDRIYRLMIAQRTLHGMHSPAEISRLFDQELDRILRELPAGADDSAAARYREARRVSEHMIVRGEFDPV